MNYTKLVKLLRMTQDDEDAPDAIKAVNLMLVQENVSWDDVLKGNVVYTTDVKEHVRKKKVKKVVVSDEVRYDNKEEILGYFEVLAERELGDFEGFVDSVYDQFQDRGYLTERQYNAIKDAALRRPRRR